MITKEELKREVDKLPNNVLEEVYVLLKKVIVKNKITKNSIEKSEWNNWNDNLEKFTPDFMENREQYNTQKRESFD